jgi:hypothetical protein
MTRFLSALIAVACLAATGCYATVRVPDLHVSPGHHEGHAYSGHGGGHDRD